MRNFYLLLLFFASSCTPSAPPVPELPDEEMVKIIADLHIAEIAAKKVHPAKKDSFLVVYYNQVYQIHHISKEKFEKAFDLLKQNPEKLAEIYEKALQSVTVMSEQ